jgi:dihydroflavonol-4-reductase
MTCPPALSALPAGWPVLVTGAGGFLGGHVARALASAGFRVRGLTRRPPQVASEDPPIEWLMGDLRVADDRARAVRGMLGVVHAGSWVSLGADPGAQSRAVNVEATRGLLDQAADAGVERFVYTSTLWTVAAGTAEAPATEDTPWNLECVRSPYCDSKREAERLVLESNGARLRTSAICPGLVIGPRAARPTSMRLLLIMARSPIVFLPSGGIPVVDAHTVALAHVRALERGEPGRRYVVAGPYLSYVELARAVARIAGRPHRVIVIPDAAESLLRASARLAGKVGRRLASELSAASVAGGFLRLHVSGSRADAAFALCHPSAAESIYAALDDARRSGVAPWLRS